MLETDPLLVFPARMHSFSTQPFGQPFNSKDLPVNTETGLTVNTEPGIGF